MVFTTIELWYEMELKQKILIYLIEHNAEEFSINQLSKLLKKDYKNTYDAIQKLKDSIDNTKKGNSNYIKFKFNLTNDVYQVENLRKNRILTNKNIEIIYNDLQKINHQFILLLFGSYAKNKQNKASDIDLLLISDNNKDIESKLDLYPLNIHLTSINYNEFKTMLLSKEFTVVSEAVKNNIILFGIEDYYRMIKNVN